MSTVQIILLCLCGIMVAATLLPLVKSDFWVFRILEYPRLQKWAIIIVLLVAMAASNTVSNLWYNIGMGLLFICVVYITVKIWPYTVMAAKQVVAAADPGDGNGLKIFTANVYQENDQYEVLLRQIKTMQPDIVFLLETDIKWQKAMKELETTHPHTVLAPLDNTYGLLFYSKLPLAEAKVLYRVEADVPSIEGVVKLPSGQRVKVFGMHPKPPVPGEDWYSTAKDKEIMKVALLVKEEPLPTIVMGDLNDVAWSYVTDLFIRTSEMLDPRIGRGFYSTFSAKHTLVRFPLDYIFCSKHFGLVSMRRMPRNGSDHFAMFIHLLYSPQINAQAPSKKADAADLQEAHEKSAQTVKK